MGCPDRRGGDPDEHRRIAQGRGRVHHRHDRRGPLRDRCRGVGANFEIELASIDLASEASEVETRRAVWFDTAKFPVARFVSSSIKDVGGGKYEVAGKLSLKGVARDAVVPIALTKDASGNSVAEGAFTIKRLDYRIGDADWADPDTVANEVVVRVRMVLPPVR